MKNSPVVEWAYRGGGLMDNPQLGGTFSRRPQIFPLPFCVWCPLRVHALLPWPIGEQRVEFSGGGVA
eukprot:9072009-Pyramimonas_sp.AAC.1